MLGVTTIRSLEVSLEHRVASLAKDCIAVLQWTLSDQIVNCMCQ
jgi:hypothetical protein